MRSLLIATTALLLAGPAVAQNNVEGRVTKLESEMRAVQRKVFPDGAGRYLQPAVEAEATPVQPSGVPAASAVADLTARVSALESQLASLTGQVEQTGYRARQMQEAFDAYKRTVDTRLKALEAAPAAPYGAGDTNSRAGDDTPLPVVKPAAKPAATTRPTATVPPAKPAVVDDEPVAGIPRPSTGDAAEDAYVYGYRLWQAKRYSEAQTALKKATADYPKARRYSYAQNLLGRAYLDDGKPSLASMAFYDNYKKMPDGERAPESLFYLGQALQKLNKPADACKVYDELTDVYAGKIGARMKADIAAGRATAKCK